MPVHRWVELTPGQAASLGDGVQRHRYIRLEAGDVTPGSSIEVGPGAEEIVIPSLPFGFQRNASSVLIPARTAQGAITLPVPTVQGQGSVATPPDPGDPWPNEPAGWALISENTCSAENEDGWTLFNSNGYATIPYADPTSPVSPSSVARIRYREGLISPGSLIPCSWVKSGWSSSSFYLGFTLWVSPNWQGHSSGVNKIWYLTDSSSGNHGDPLFFLLRGIDSGTLTFEVMHQNPDISPVQHRYRWDGTDNELSPASGVSDIVRGTWNRIEVRADGNTPGSSNGAIRYWVNSTAVYRNTGAAFLSPDSDGTFDNGRLEPIYGGQNDTIPEDQQLHIGHIRLLRAA